MKTYEITFKDKLGKVTKLTTGFNGDIKEAEKYYIGNAFNLGNGEQDYMCFGYDVVKVEE